MQKERLQKLWDKYKGQMTSGELNAILDRGICYSKIEKTHRILVTGMNPSFRQGDPARENSVCEYEYQGIVEAGKRIRIPCGSFAKTRKGLNSLPRIYG